MNKGIRSFFCSLCSPYSIRTRNSIFIYDPIHLTFHFNIRHQFKSAPTLGQQQQLSRHSNKISNLHSAFDISSRRSQQNIYIDVRERRPLRPRRACCSEARPHHFVGATPTKLCRAERVRPAAPRITLRFYETPPRRTRSPRGTPQWARNTLRLRLRLRHPAAPSAFALRHPRITLRLLRLRNSAAPSAFAQRPPAFTLRLLRLRNPAAPTSGTLGHCYIAFFLAIYHLGYIAPAKLLYSKGAISILCYTSIATCYIAIL